MECLWFRRNSISLSKSWDKALTLDLEDVYMTGSERERWPGEETPVSCTSRDHFLDEGVFIRLHLSKNDVFGSGSERRVEPMKSSHSGVKAVLILLERHGVLKHNFSNEKCRQSCSKSSEWKRRAAFAALAEGVSVLGPLLALSSMVRSFSATIVVHGAEPM